MYRRTVYKVSVCVPMCSKLLALHVTEAEILSAIIDMTPFVVAHALATCMTANLLAGQSL